MYDCVVVAQSLEDEHTTCDSIDRIVIGSKGLFGYPVINSLIAIMTMMTLVLQYYTVLEVYKTTFRKYVISI